MKLMYRGALAAFAALLLSTALASSAFASEAWEEYEVVPNPVEHRETFAGSGNIRFEPAWGIITCKVLIYGEFTGPKELEAKESYQECSSGTKPFETETLRGVIGGVGGSEAVLKLEGKGTSVFAPQFRGLVPEPIYGKVMGWLTPDRQKTSTLGLLYIASNGKQSPQKFPYAKESANILEFGSEALPVSGDLSLSMTGESPEIELKKVKA